MHADALGRSIPSQGSTYTEGGENSLAFALNLMKQLFYFFFVNKVCLAIGKNWEFGGKSVLEARNGL